MGRTPTEDGGLDLPDSDFFLVGLDKIIEGFFLKQRVKILGATYLVWKKARCPHLRVLESTGLERSSTRM